MTSSLLVLFEARSSANLQPQRSDGIFRSSVAPQCSIGTGIGQLIGDPVKCHRLVKVSEWCRPGQQSGALYIVAFNSREQVSRIPRRLCTIDNVRIALFCLKGPWLKEAISDLRDQSLISRRSRVKILTWESGLSRFIARRTRVLLRWDGLRGRSASSRRSRVKIWAKSQFYLGSSQGEQGYFRRDGPPRKSRSANSRGGRT